MFLALYFATEEERPEVACNDNDGALQGSWYANALQRIAENGRTWNDRHAAALAGSPAE